MIWYILIGLYVGFNLQLVYFRYFMKRDGLFSFLLPEDEANLCQWAVKHKEDLNHLIVMFDDGFIDYKEAWEMYQREFDE